MGESFQLRVYSYLDRMQPQFAAFVGTITQGDLPISGMAALYIEVAPGNEVFRLVDIAVKATEARPGAQIVEREFGMFEIHSRSQAEVLEAGRIVLERLALREAERIKPFIASVQVITNVDPYQSQLINRFRRGSMLVPGETMLVLECAPAAYVNFAANEAEKGASIKLIHISALGRFGRMWLSGSESEILQARDAAIDALAKREGSASRSAGRCAPDSSRRRFSLLARPETGGGRRAISRRRFVAGGSDRTYLTTRRTPDSHLPRHRAVPRGRSRKTHRSPFSHPHRRGERATSCIWCEDPALRRAIPLQPVTAP
jgi:hypothetical protein